MKKLLIIIFIILSGNESFCQLRRMPKGHILPAYNFSSNSRIGVFNINSTRFIRILDGFQLAKDYKIPLGIKINSGWELNDSVKLRELKLPYKSKPYLILNTMATSIRQFIYTKADIGHELLGMNIPIILNNRLITPDKYSMLEKLKSNQIYKIKFIKSVPSRYKKEYEMPWGAIEVMAK